MTAAYQCPICDERHDSKPERPMCSGEGTWMNEKGERVVAPAHVPIPWRWCGPSVTPP